MTARVLVVDDILSNVKLLEAKLTAEYFEVLTACSGEQALTRVVAELPDIVLLDVMMPGMDGYEVCRWVRSNPATRHVAVVILSGKADPECVARGMEVGADEYLAKPITPSNLTRQLILQRKVAKGGLPFQFTLSVRAVGGMIAPLIVMDQLQGGHDIEIRFGQHAEQQQADLIER